jgi:hypothetical protein
MRQMSAWHISSDRFAWGAPISATLVYGTQNTTGFGPAFAGHECFRGTVGHDWICFGHALAKSKELFTLLDLCVSSLRRGHANLLCIVPILTDDPRRESVNICAAARECRAAFCGSPLPGGLLVAASCSFVSRVAPPWPGLLPLSQGCCLLARAAPYSPGLLPLNQG